jgi:NDP-sugar pyrophosphorylase family protein
MKAMVLAAGLGTRLGALTADRPKALITVSGRTLLEIALTRLRTFGINEVVINVHHHAEMIVDYLAANRNFSMRIEVSREDELLDTGGGLKKAAHFFLDAGGDEPFLVHNVDVLSSFDVGRMVEFHNAQTALATLAVQHRVSSRQLLFDSNSRLRGRRIGEADNVQSAIAPAATSLESLAFSGIHVVSPQIFSMFTEQGTFSIVDAYLRLAAQGETIAAYRADGCYWRDLGRPESLAGAESDLASGKFSIG